jgi:hypothetical protein
VVGDSGGGRCWGLKESEALWWVVGDDRPCSRPIRHRGPVSAQFLRFVLRGCSWLSDPLCVRLAGLSVPGVL